MFPEGLSAELASRETILAGLEYLLDHLDGVRRGTQKHDRLMRKVATSSRPLVTAKAICKDYASVLHQVENRITHSMPATCKSFGCGYRGGRA